MSKLRECLLKGIDCVLSVREDMGAQIHDVYLIDRRWSGERVGDGQFSDSLEKISPTPSIKDYSHDVRVTNVGAVKAGDLIVTGISRNKYPDELRLRTDTEDRNHEKLYKVGKHFYTLVHIKENLVTWDIHLRKKRLDESERR